jgi:hypothetical protein
MLVLAALSISGTNSMRLLYAVPSSVLKTSNHRSLHLIFHLLLLSILIPTENIGNDMFS